MRHKASIPAVVLYLIGTSGPGASGAPPPGFDSGPRWSPDGRTIAFHSTHAGGADVLIMDADGRSVINVTKGGTEDDYPAWSPYGRWILSSSGQKDRFNLWRMRADGTRRERVTDHPRRDQHPAWRPQPPLPIIDMHLHANDGTLPWALCVPWVTQVPAWDPKRPWKDVWNDAVTNPPCPDPIWPPKGEAALMKGTIDVLERRNIVGVLSGLPERVLRWKQAAPGRFIPAVQFELGADAISPESLRKMFESGSFAVFGEVTNQYAGIAPDDERMEPYWALAEELDVPVAIHLGEGILGTAYIGRPGYRARLSSPFLLEEVLVRHPRLRVYVMHYASPLIDELIAMLGAFPQLYVDIGGIQWFYPRAYFHEQLRRIIDAGFGKRVMFGSDQGDWPGVIEPAIAIVEEAPFLSGEQKRDIFYNNAARFLRLSAKDIARHHGR